MYTEDKRCIPMGEKNVGRLLIINNEDSNKMEWYL